jgi:hypothetical protein
LADPLTILLSHLATGAIFATCGFALVKGDAQERQAGMVLFIDTVAWNFAVADVVPTEKFSVFFWLDLVLFGTFALLSWKSVRTWPIWASAFQSIAVFVDICRNFGLKLPPFTYFSAINVSTYGVLVMLTLGTFIAWRERAALRAFGIDGQPSTSSPASARAIRSSVRPTPKMATKDPNRGPWF